MKNKFKVLIIDDEPLIRMMLGEFFREAGFQTFEAENGQVGLEIYRREQPNIVTLDLRMPVVDGFMFFEESKAAENPRCDVMVITGHGGRQEVEQARKFGAACFYRKPFDHLEVIEKAVELCELQPD